MNDAASAVDGLWNGIVQRHEQLRHDRHRPILDPAEVYLTPRNFSSYSSGRRVQLHTFGGRRRPRNPIRISPALRRPRCASIRAPSSRRRNW